MHKISTAVGTLLVIFALNSTSCSSQKTTTEEETQIKAMDSASTKLKATTENLEEKTKDVEKALEELDKEFDNKN